MSNYLLIKQGTIHNAIEEEPFVADILVENGKIKKIAPVLEGKIINDADVIDATGIDVYPGFVDAHCHMGLDGYATGFAGEDYNESGDPVTPQLSAVDAVNPQDETFQMAREGGVTCVCTGPGSSNVIGGTFCAIKTYGKRVDDMLVKEKTAMKIAFGENPKNCYKEKGVYSRMSVAAKLREALTKAKIYDTKLHAAGCPEGWNELEMEQAQEQVMDDSQKTDADRKVDFSKMPAYDAKMEALLPVIRGEMPLKAHAHRADDIYTAIRIAKEFHVDLRIDHTTDGALIADDLAKEGFPVAVGPSFGHATKYELRLSRADSRELSCRSSTRQGFHDDELPDAARLLAHYPRRRADLRRGHAGDQPLAAEAGEGVKEEETHSRLFLFYNQIRMLKAL